MKDKIFIILIPLLGTAYVLVTLKTIQWWYIAWKYQLL